MLFLPAAGIMLLSGLTLMSTHHTLIQRVHPDYMSQSLDRSAHGAEADIPIGSEKHGMQPLEQGENTGVVKKDLKWENYTWQNLGYYGLQILEKLYIVDIIQEDNFLAPVHTDRQSADPSAPPVPQTEKVEDEPAVAIAVPANEVAPAVVVAETAVVAKGEKELEL